MVQEWARWVAVAARPKMAARTVLVTAATVRQATESPQQLPITLVVAVEVTTTWHP